MKEKNEKFKVNSCHFFYHVREPYKRLERNYTKDNWSSYELSGQEVYTIIIGIYTMDRIRLLCSSKHEFTIVLLYNV